MRDILQCFSPNTVTNLINISIALEAESTEYTIDL